MSYSEFESNSLSLDICDSYNRQTEPELTRLIFDSNDQSLPTESQIRRSSIKSKQNKTLKIHIPFLVVCLIIIIIWFLSTFFENFLILINPLFNFSGNQLNQNQSIVSINDLTQWTTLPIQNPIKPIHYEIINPSFTHHDDGWTILTLHGLGSINASDAFFIKDNLFKINSSFINQTQFIIPFANRLSVDVWNGHQTPAWFNIHDWSNLRSFEDLIHMKENVIGLNQIIKELGLNMRKTIFMGFSQGAVMSLLLSLNVDQPPAGVIMLSGFLPVPKELSKMILPNRKGISSLYWLHGESDPYFPISEAQIGFNTLKSFKFFKSIRFESFIGLDHQFNLDEINSAVQWIQKLMKQ